jgi:predicted porin
LAYYDGEYKNGLGSKGDLKTTVLFNEYNLSKRTNLYGIIDHAKASNDLVATTKSTNVGITAGIRHTF